MSAWSPLGREMAATTQNHKVSKVLNKRPLFLEGTCAFSAIFSLFQRYLLKKGGSLYGSSYIRTVFCMGACFWPFCLRRTGKRCRSFRPLPKRFYPGKHICPAVIAYPELSDGELVASPLYQQALERPSVILYDGEILTDPQPVEDFLAAVEKGEDWDLYLYIFRVSDSGDRDCYLQHFVSNKGAVTYRDGFENQWDSLKEGGEVAVNDLSLNEYGYLVYGADSGQQVVNDRALYDNVEECRKLYERYFPPVLYLGLGSRTWASPQELTSWVGLFEDIYRYETGGSAFDRFGSDWPVEEMVETLSRYFDGVTAELVIGERKTAGAYDPETGTIHYEGGRGGGPICYRVTGWEQEGETLSIDYEEYDFYTGAPFEDSFYRLTMKNLEDGSFRYLSNLPRER